MNFYNFLQYTNIKYHCYFLEMSFANIWTGNARIEIFEYDLSSELACCREFTGWSCSSLTQLCLSDHLQVIWNTSPSWSRGACWRCWLTSTSGPAKKLSASPTSLFPCWSWSQRKEPRRQSACATLGSPSSGDLLSLHLPPFLPTLSRDCNRSLFPIWAYQMNIYFSYFCFCRFGLPMFSLLSWCFRVRFALYLLVLLSVWWRRDSSGLYYFVVTLAPTAVLRSPTHRSKPVIVLLVTHPCFVTLLH